MHPDELRAHTQNYQFISRRWLGHDSGPACGKSVVLTVANAIATLNIIISRTSPDRPVHQRARALLQDIIYNAEG